MKKILFSILVFTFVLTACGTSQAGLQFSDPAQPIEVVVGDEFTIALDSNPSTGYHWEFVGEPDASIIEFVSKEYTADEPVQPGSGGVDVLSFKSIAAGETQITLGYYPPSADAEEPQQTVTFTVIVK